MERGRYATQLKHLYAIFDREQVLVLQYERCRQEPVEQYRRTLQFLGARNLDWIPEELERTRGNPAPGKEDVWPDLQTALHAMLDDEVLELPALVPEFDLTLWPNFAHLAAAHA